MKNYGTRIIANNVEISNNTYETGLNNNDLIVGPSGSGKSMGYVIPNIQHTSDSFITVDTKGMLYKKTAAALKKKGYDVHLIDFKNPEKSTIGYNPFDYVKIEKQDNYYEPNELDIIGITEILNPVEDHEKEPFWAQAAAKYMDGIIAYMFTVLREEEHNMSTLARLVTLLDTDKWKRMVSELEHNLPNCLAVRRANYMEKTRTAEKMNASIVSILDTNIAKISAKELNTIYSAKHRINFRDLGRKKTALFINVSDSDRSLDHLLNLFYTQVLQELITSADEDYEDGRLKVPVRLFLDDFASNFVIRNFDCIASVVRSRDIYISVVIQSLSQLDAMYGEYKARTIINNCDVQLYLGGQDVPTAEYYSKKSNRPLDKVLQMPLNKMFLFVRGSEPKLVDRYNFKSCPAPEFSKKTISTGKEA